MPSKQFTLDERTTVTVYKRRSSRHLRLSVAAGGEVRVSIPLWASYQAGITFARSRLAWIHQQQRPTKILTSQQSIGKTYQLYLLPSAGISKASSRVVGQKIIITYPASLQASDTIVQTLAETACIRALKKEAESQLPARLANLAAEHDFRFSSVRIKRLKSRWGSCDQQQNIVLNLFLMQLPWECIDYVLLHELNHTEHLHHGSDFWDNLRQLVPDLNIVRKRLRAFQPTLI